MSVLRRGAAALAAAGLCTAIALQLAGAAGASPSIRYGIMDDAWLRYGPGTLDSRLSELTQLGVDVVRYTVRWDQVAQNEPADARDPRDAAYDWRSTDEVLSGLRRHRLAPVVTLLGTPAWANGGHPPSWAPTSGRTFADFAYAAARRYSWVRFWTIWNEPNQPRWLRPTSARTYVRILLDPAYAEIHAAIPTAVVAGGVTSPRAATAGVAPVAWIRALGVLGAHLDAYAHHPYASRPQSESPWSPPCARCSSLTMADLQRLRALVRRAFGPKRIWLTEYGYQTNPPDALLGVTPAVQASHYVSAARRAYLAPDVDMLVYYLVRDDSASEGWQSGLVTSSGVEKPAYAAFRIPLTQTGRSGGRAVLWGQVRPRSGRQPYRVQLRENGRSSWIGGTRWTDERGFLSIAVRASPGSRLRIWSPRDRAWSLEIRLR